jgi:hypothetical protein
MICAEWKQIDAFANRQSSSGQRAQVRTVKNLEARLIRFRGSPIADTASFQIQETDFAGFLKLRSFTHG